MSQTQEIKAKQIMDKIMHVQENTWLLPSLSEPDKYHTVTFNGNSLECDCRGFMFTQSCYHVIAVSLQH